MKRQRLKSWLKTAGEVGKEPEEVFLCEAVCIQTLHEHTLKADTNLSHPILADYSSRTAQGRRRELSNQTLEAIPLQKVQCNLVCPCSIGVEVDTMSCVWLAV